VSDQAVEDFRSAFAEAAGIEAPEAPPPAGDTAEQTTTEPPEAAEAEAAEETTPEETTTAAEETALLAGKYKDQAALEAGYKELERSFRERDAELGELRKLREDFATLREEIAPGRQQATVDQAALDEYLVENPHQIPAVVQAALDSGDGVSYHKGLAAWQELDPIGAMDFHARAVAAAHVEELRQEQEQTATSQAETAGQLEAAYAAAKTRHPDFDAVINSISQDTLNGFPAVVLDTLKTGDQASKEQVLETLYRWTKAEQAGAIQETAAQVAADTQADSQAARQAAAVATTTATGERGPVSGVDAFREQFRSSDAFKRAAGEA
jgi:hypothetical protein